MFSTPDPLSRTCIEGLSMRLMSTCPSFQVEVSRTYFSVGTGAISLKDKAVYWKRSLYFGLSTPLITFVIFHRVLLGKCEQKAWAY